MVHLPTEILYQILSELREKRGRVRLAPLATVNRHWQSIVEGILWRRIYISIGDIATFHVHFSAEFGRRKLLKSLVCDLSGYFHNSFAQTESTPIEQNTADSDVESDDQDEAYEDSESSKESKDDQDDQDDQDSTGGEEHREGTVTMNEQTGQDWVDSNEAVIFARFSAFQDEHFRFFRELKMIWDELASWKETLNVTSMELYVEAYCIYTLLGPAFRDLDTVQRYLSDDSWLESRCLVQLPYLPSVKALAVHLDVHREPAAAVWPQIVTCKLARTLPALESLETPDNSDLERRWHHARKYFRETLAKQILKLPSSLQIVAFLLEFHAIANHEIDPPCFLNDGGDSLSTSLHRLSFQLTTLAVRINHISSTLFWDSRVPYKNSHHTLWPNLSIVDIRTGFETADGKYWMRPASTFPAQLPKHWYVAEGEEEDQDFTESEVLYKSLGYWPCRLFRERPEPGLFDELAISIARAAACMPRLIYMNMEFSSLHREESNRRRFKHFLNYEGWAFYFRSNNKARFASTYLEWEGGHEPGPDRTDIGRPRTEWVFQIPYKEVQWQEPEEAQELWRAKFAHVDLDLVTFEYEEESGVETWEIRRAGKVICSSTRSDDCLPRDLDNDY